MSISILLMPLAVAAATAIAARSELAGDRVVCHVQTRMRDETLLRAALENTGAFVTVDAAGLDCSWGEGVRGTFHRDQDGIWSAHFTGTVDEERAIELVKAVDAAYGRQVQRTVVQRIRERAGGCGLRLESEASAEDASVRLVFAVEGGAS